MVKLKTQRFKRECIKQPRKPFKKINVPKVAQLVERKYFSAR